MAYHFVITLLFISNGKQLKNITPLIPYPPPNKNSNPLLFYTLSPVFYYCFAHRISDSVTPC